MWSQGQGQNTQQGLKGLGQQRSNVRTDRCEDFMLPDFHLGNEVGQGELETAIVHRDKLQGLLSTRQQAACKMHVFQHSLAQQKHHEGRFRSICYFFHCSKTVSCTSQFQLDHLL
eukprot:Skav228784  [mRNA]  locus=scaffold589:643198:653132:+ [translate_table: standard]